MANAELRMTEMADKAQPGLWYVKRGDEVKGPFRWESIDRYVALGRIHASDRLSQDRVQWRRVRAFRDRLSEAGRNRAHGGIAVFDERGGERRAVGPDRSRGADEQRDGGERRTRESAEVSERRARSERVWAGLKTRSQQCRGPMAATAVLLGAVLLLAVTLSMPPKHDRSDCTALGAPQVNWDYCSKPGVRVNDQELARLSARNAKLAGAIMAGSDLTGSNLAYADLTGADLSLSDLSDARMVGANLSGAKLGHARMAGADLRFADLSGAAIAGADFTGAQLANAIWIDGRICERRSVGACNAR